MSKTTSATQSYIYEAFVKLLKTKNYDKISVCDICEKAGVSRMSFYRNFESKEQLTLKGLTLITNKIKNKTEELEQKNAYTISKIFYETFVQYKDIIKSFDGSEISKGFIMQITNKLKENYPSDYMNKNSKYIPVFYFGAISTMIYNWLNSGAEETPEEMARLTASLIKFDVTNNNTFDVKDGLNISYEFQKESPKAVQSAKK